MARRITWTSTVIMTASRMPSKARSIRTVTARRTGAMLMLTTTAFSTAPKDRQATMRMPMASTMPTIRSPPVRWMRMAMAWSMTCSRWIPMATASRMRIPTMTVSPIIAILILITMGSMTLTRRALRTLTRTAWRTWHDADRCGRSARRRW